MRRVLLRRNKRAFGSLPYQTAPLPESAQTLTIRHPTGKLPNSPESLLASGCCGFESGNAVQAV
jgi:hypothetical protein